MKGLSDLRSALLLAVIVTGACASHPRRNPSEAVTVSADFRRTTVIDVAVVPVEVEEDIRFPAVDAREMIRRILIDTKRYAVPRSAWVDARLADGEDLGADAILTARITGWDTASLVSRGVIYASAAFELKAPSGTSLWKGSCRDLQLAVSGPYGARATPANSREAARQLVSMVLSSLPRKR